MKTYIQHKDKGGQKLILQALVPFTLLKDTVLFTYRANIAEKGNDKHTQYEASMEYYQRRVDAKRSDEIKNFIRQTILLEMKGAQLATLFPTSMILALSTDEDDKEGNSLKIEEDGSCQLDMNTNVFIVDGQHRMMGMIKLYDELDRLVVKTDEDDYVYKYLQNYKFNCTILVNYDLWEQGQVFVNVNFKQKPVNKSLYYEIFGSEYREDSKDWNRNKIYLAHQIAIKLNENPESPFYQKIKMLGTGTGYVSQAFVVESLLRHFKDGGLWYFNPEDITNEGIYTNCYAIELISYFVAIKQSFLSYWPKEEEKKGRIICKTTGFGAWVRLMGMMRDDEDKQLLCQLKKSADNNTVCQPYVEHVTRLLKPLLNYAETLFGKNSQFKSSSGQGSEGKLYKKMLFYLQKKQTDDDKKKSYPFDVDKVSEELQEFIWVTPIDELVMLGHHYEVEDIEGFEIVQYKNGIDAYEIKATFNVYVNIYIDNEDDTGFNMEFPAEATILLEKDGDEYHMDESNTKIYIDTEKYYQ